MQTIKEIANAAEVSKTTVRRHINKIKAEQGEDFIKQNTAVNENGVFCFTDTLAAMLKDAIAGTPVKARISEHRNATPEQETGTAEQAGEDAGTHTGTIEENAATGDRNTGTNDRNAETMAALYSLIDELKADKADLQQQLREKDEQIKELTASLLSTTDRVTEALTNAQKLHAVEVSNNIIEDVTEQPGKKQFSLLRLFKRK